MEMIFIYIWAFSIMTLCCEMKMLLPWFIILWHIVVNKVKINARWPSRHLWLTHRRQFSKIITFSTIYICLHSSIFRRRSRLQVWYRKNPARRQPASPPLAHSHPFRPLFSGGCCDDVSSALSNQLNRQRKKKNQKSGKKEGCWWLDAVVTHTLENARVSLIIPHSAASFLWLLLVAPANGQCTQPLRHRRFINGIFDRKSSLLFFCLVSVCNIISHQLMCPIISYRSISSRTN